MSYKVLCSKIKHLLKKWLIKKTQDMITLDPQIEYQLITLASEKGLSISELIKNFMLIYQAEQDAVNLADKSYAEGDGNK